ncbi:hypothetical protein GpartN1_g5216.t1 [Galdieria partita]|uniref:Uncharacterized protein n=1 Tax=Galdieria partita TaxID=83374 RepID=A0A9C7PZP8_9RHOD|nr:hypothetical protein GpartN1_g5216.t1 [Galdieria partita]
MSSSIPYKLYQVVEEAEAFLGLYASVLTKVSDESLLQMITMLSTILSHVLDVFIDSTSPQCFSLESRRLEGDIVSAHMSTSSSLVDKGDNYLHNTNETTSQAVFQESNLFGTNKNIHNWGYCHLEQFYFGSSCSYQAVLHYNKLSVATCKNEDILHVVNTIFKTYQKNFASSMKPTEVIIQDIQSHLYQSIQRSVCEWDLTNVLVESVEYVRQGNSISYFVDSLCSYLLDCANWNNYGWKMMGSFIVMLEVLLSKVDITNQLSSNSLNFFNRLSPLYIQNLLLRFFGCSDCSARRSTMSEMFQGILMSILQIYQLQHYSEAILSLYLDLFYIYSSPYSTISYRNGMEALFQWMRETCNGDWIQQMNCHHSLQHNELLSETVLFVLRWLPFSFVCKIGYHNSQTPLNIYHSPHRLDWLLLALERKYEQKKLIFSSSQNDVSDWIQLMMGYLLSIYVFEQSTKVGYEKVIGEHIWKWLRLSVDSFPLWQSCLVLLAVVGRTWLLLFSFSSPESELQSRHFWILIERLVSLLQMEQLSLSQRTILAWTIVFMWPRFILSKNCQSKSTCYSILHDDIEKSIVFRFFQWYEKSLLSTSPWLSNIHFWIKYYQNS